MNTEEERIEREAEDFINDAYANIKRGTAMHDISVELYIAGAFAQRKRNKDTTLYSQEVIDSYEEQLKQRDETIKQLTNGLIELRNNFKQLADDYEKSEIPTKVFAYRYAAKKVNDLIKWHDLEQPVNF